MLPEKILRIVGVKMSHDRTILPEKISVKAPGDLLRQKTLVGFSKTLVLERFTRIFWRRTLDGSGAERQSALQQRTPGAATQQLI